jgi:hypothetical protein
MLTYGQKKFMCRIALFFECPGYLLPPQAGDIILPARSFNDKLYLLLRGSADELDADGGMLVRQISSGNPFGDRAFLTETRQV